MTENPQTEEPKKPDDSGKPDYDYKRTAAIIARQDDEDVMATVNLLIEKRKDLFMQVDPQEEPKMPDEKPATDPKETKPPEEPKPDPKPPEPKKDEPPSDDMKSMQKELHDMKIRTAKLEAIGDFEHLTKGDIGLISGNTVEEVMESAKALNERLAAMKPAPSDNGTGDKDKKPDETPKDKTKDYTGDDNLPPPTDGPVTVDDVARIAMTEEGAKKIAQEAAAEGRRIYDSGGPRFAAGD